MRKIGLAFILVLELAAAARAAMPAPTAVARQTAMLLQHAGDDGLDPARYRAGDVSALSAFARDLSLGRPALRMLDADMALPAVSFDPQAAVEEAERDGQVAHLAEVLAPPYPQYAALKGALAKYRAIALAGGWPQLTRAARSFDSEPQSTLVRQRLAFEDSVIADPASDLREGVVRFQRRHGLEPDGILGRATLAALNITAAVRADTILANMERWRWMPRTLERDRIVINAAAAELTLVLDNREILTSRVIVGRPHDPTPMLRADAAGLTVNPPWNVPASIAAREILPKLKHDPHWLARQDMVLLNGPPGDPQGLTVNWSAVPAGTFPYRVRQHPGPKNPLGQIKLELPNRFDVYLHDTPARAAFARDKRDLSHGCVRVEKILPLASYAMSSNLAAMDAIVAAIDTGETSYLPLHKSLPVYFLYWTAFAEPDGVIQFRPDIYGRDLRLFTALRGPVRVAAGFPAGCARG